MATIHKGGFEVRIPKGARGIGPTAEVALNQLIAEKRGKLSNEDGCTIVFFRSGHGLVAAQRCEHRSLRAHNRDQCRRKTTAGKKHPRGQFVVCK
jgi:hypothetical protein